MNVIEAKSLGKHYRGTWALRECTLAIPAGHVAALVGPNGAGKTTLLNLAVGLAAPSAGAVTVLGGRPAGSPAALDGIAFVAQDTPVYKNLSAADLLHLTRNLNRHFDMGYARARLVVLYEPLANLDPVARHDFMATVMTAVADDGVSVLLSSHVLAELERVADYLILMSCGSVQVAGEIDDLLACHRVLAGPAAEAAQYAERSRVVHARSGQALAHLLVRTSGPADPV